MLANKEYIANKLAEAKAFVRTIVGLKPCYFEKDVFLILKEFGYIETLTLDEVGYYLPTKGYDFSCIESFTQGYIKSDRYKIYAIRMEKHFNLFVVSFNEYKELESYYSVTISEETLNICFIFEVMIEALNEN